VNNEKTYPLRPPGDTAALRADTAFLKVDNLGYTALLKQFVGVLRTTQRVLAFSVIRRMPRHHRMVMPCCSSSASMQKQCQLVEQPCRPEGAVDKLNHYTVEKYSVFCGLQAL